MEADVTTCPHPWVRAEAEPPVSRMREPPTGIVSLYSVAGSAPATESGQPEPSGRINRREKGAGVDPVFTNIVVVCQYRCGLPAAAVCDL